MAKDPPPLTITSTSRTAVIATATLFVFSALITLGKIFVAGRRVEAVVPSKECGIRASSVVLFISVAAHAFFAAILYLLYRDINGEKRVYAKRQYNLVLATGVILLCVIVALGLDMWLEVDKQDTPFDSSTECVTTAWWFNVGLNLVLVLITGLLLYIVYYFDDILRVYLRITTVEDYKAELEWADARSKRAVGDTDKSDAAMRRNPAVGAPSLDSFYADAQHDGQNAAGVTLDTGAAHAMSREAVNKV